MGILKIGLHLLTAAEPLWARLLIPYQNKSICTTSKTFDDICKFMSQCGHCVSRKRIYVQLKISFKYYGTNAKFDFCQQPTFRHKYENFEKMDCRRKLSVEVMWEFWKSDPGKEIAFSSLKTRNKFYLNQWLMIFSQKTFKFTADPFLQVFQHDV